MNLKVLKLIIICLVTKSLFCQEILRNKFIFSPADNRLESNCKDITTEKDSIDFSKAMRLEFNEKEYIENTHEYYKDEHIGLNQIAAEALFPHWFYKKTEFVPNVYTYSEYVNYIGKGNVEIFLPVEHKLRVDDTVMIYDKNNVKTSLIVEYVPTKKSFVVKDKLPKSEYYFVYGVKVDDFKELHYQELIILNLRITQLMNSRIRKLEIENKKINEKIRELERKMKKNKIR